MKLSDAELCKGFDRWKNYALWGQIGTENKNFTHYPIIYFRPSKYISKETYEKIMKAISIAVKEDIDIFKEPKE